MCKTVAKMFIFTEINSDIVKYSLLFCFFLVLFSCGNKQNTIETKKTIEKPKFSVVKKHNTVQPIKDEYKEVVEQWEELNTVNSFVKKFENVSPREALTNALELRDLVKSLKDSVVPKTFDHPSFFARVNVLYNETLRLSDLTRIPAITADDVNQQVNKTIIATGAVNSKINTVLKQKYLEDNIALDLDRIGIDSTKIDSITKNSIQRELTKEIEEN